jgi:hypothetical protein
VKQVADSSLHLVCGFVGERHREDGFWPSLEIVDQVRNPVGNHAGLAAAGARKNQDRTFGRLNSFELLWIEKLT